MDLTDLIVINVRVCSRLVHNHDIEDTDTSTNTSPTRFQAHQSVEARSPRLTSWKPHTLSSNIFNQHVRGVSDGTTHGTALGRFVHVSVGGGVLGVPAPAVVVGRAVGVVVVVAPITSRPS